ncbi:helix-turn-helix domain-containing protein [Phytohabitans kaempferiae]|uniref:Helix-turn-helix domain-containing protein n=1 Tax=Phytohabitans kaempferiae TaxID=1620943 RepID=A0ABV6LYQ2_9ACTN
MTRATDPGAVHVLGAPEAWLGDRPAGAQGGRDAWAGSQFGQVLRTYRTRRRMTQRQLADLSTVSVRAIRDIEQGRSARPRPETVRLIATGLGLTGRGRADFEAACGFPAVGEPFRQVYEPQPMPPPVPLDGLVGRDLEVRAIQQLLTPGHQRFLTIAGLAAVGKTRVALEVAGALYHSEGVPVLWMSAAGAQPADRGPSDRWREPLRLAFDELVAPPDDTGGELCALIGDRPTLLVLDGYRPGQLRAGRLSRLLQECRGLRVLATARVPVGILGERAFPLLPLAVPKAEEERDAETLARVPSVRLLIRGARHVRPEIELTGADLRAVAELCRRLDGLPLALEAVAKWLLVYEPEVLLQLVEADPFDLTDRSPMGEDSAGMRCLLGEAVESLEPSERLLLARLAETGDGWTVRGAADATGIPGSACASVVGRLLTRGVVRYANGTDRSRFVVLNLVRHLLRQQPERSRTRVDEVVQRVARIRGGAARPGRGWPEVVAEQGREVTGHHGHLGLAPRRELRMTAIAS